MLRAHSQDGSQATGMDVEDDDGDVPVSHLNAQPGQLEQPRPANSQLAGQAGQSRSSRLKKDAQRLQRYYSRAIMSAMDNRSELAAGTCLQWYHA